MKEVTSLVGTVLFALILGLSGCGSPVLPMVSYCAIGSSAACEDLRAAYNKHRGTP